MTTVTKLEPLAISLQDVAEKKLLPLSRSSLYRWAETGESPFSKIQGKWMTTPELLKEAIEQGPKPRAKSIGNPMPKTGDFMEEVEQLEKELG